MDVKALFKIGYGLYVLSARDGEKDNGCIINTVMQVTNIPIFITIGVDKNNYTHDMILKTKEFNLSVLTTNTPFEIFKRFGYQTGKTINKFDGLDSVKRSENGIFYLAEGSNSYFSCKVIETIDFGTHTLFKADVIEAQVLSEEETLTYTYYQAHIKPKPQETTKKGWRCNICGYIFEGEVLPDDFICPICKHGAADFTKL